MQLKKISYSQFKHSIKTTIPKNGSKNKFTSIINISKVVSLKIRYSLPAKYEYLINFSSNYGEIIKNWNKAPKIYFFNLVIRAFLGMWAEHVASLVELPDPLQSGYHLFPKWKESYLKEFAQKWF